MEIKGFDSSLRAKTNPIRLSSTRELFHTTVNVLLAGYEGPEELTRCKGERKLGEGEIRLFLGLVILAPEGCLCETVA